jgi:uncharacterized protein involved in exopolysaccharide biosynthesis
MAEDKSNYNFESTDLIVYLWKRRIPLIIITLAAAVISTIVSFTITPMFKSTVTLFPASESPVSKSLFQVNYQDRVGILGFGEEEQLERILQVLHSDQIRDDVIEKFNLMQHYEIDSLERFPITRLYSEYESNIKFKRTEYNSIVIEVMDKDPLMAAEIANEISVQVDSTMNQMKRRRALKAFELVKQEYQDAQERVKTMNDSVSYYIEKGAQSYDRKIERYAEAYGKAVLEGNSRLAERLQEQIMEVSDLTGPYLLFYDLRNTEMARMRDLSSKFIEAKAETELVLSHVFILDKAIVAEKKAYPKKSIIVIVSTLAAFILAVILFLFFESFLKKIRAAA